MGDALHILLVDDESIVRETLVDYLNDLGHHVDEAHDGLQGLQAIQSVEFDMILADIRMPRIDGLELLSKAQEICPETPFVIITGHASLELAVEALRRGAADFLKKPIRLLELDAVVQKTRRLQELRRNQRQLHETIGVMNVAASERSMSRYLIGESEATQQVRAEIQRAVDANCQTIMVTGATGSGKEVVAREIHFRAGQKDAPFIAVSCPALPDALVESELFGHVRGAFTGATESRTGYLQLADEGTLFLDEIADLSAAAQASVLRALETRAFRPVGSTQELSVNVRIVAATNLPLDDLVAQGAFREDLYYRLNVFSIHLAPLRERPDDLMPLAEHFLARYRLSRREKNVGFTPDAKSLLQSYHYPGNVRELRNIVERAVILCGNGPIDVDHIILGPIQRPPVAVPEPAPVPTTPQSSGSRERDMILEALEASRWNRRDAARNLGIPYSTLRYKMLKLEIR